MRFRSVVFGVFLFLLSFPALAGNVIVDYTLTNLGSGQYRSTYSVTNNGALGAGVPIQLFDILFDPTAYQGLTIVTPNPLATQWDESILFGVPPDPPYFDAFALNGGIAVGNTASGFAVQFMFIGTGQPGPQPFRIYDASTFALLESGTTASNVAPEPSTLGLLGIILAYGARRLSRRT